MLKELVIYGTGGLARELHEIVEDINDVRGNEWNLIGFLDDNEDRRHSAVRSVPVLGGGDWLVRHPHVHVVVAIGNSTVRRRVTDRMGAAGHTAFASLVHPQATVGRRVSIGTGSVICAGAVITTDIQIGNHVVVHYNCTVGHDAVIGDWTTIAPGANVSGNVTVGTGCELGANSAIIQGISIGDWSIVGAGAVVIEAVSPNVTVVGVPAKPIKERPEGWHLL